MRSVPMFPGPLAPPWWPLMTATNSAQTARGRVLATCWSAD